MLKFSVYLAEFGILFAVWFACLCEAQPAAPSTCSLIKSSLEKFRTEPARKLKCHQLYCGSDTLANFPAKLGIPGTVAMFQRRRISNSEPIRIKISRKSLLKAKKDVVVWWKMAIGKSFWMMFGWSDLDFLWTCRYVILTDITRNNLEVSRVTQVYIFGTHLIHFRDKNDDSSRLKAIRRRQPQNTTAVVAHSLITLMCFIHINVYWYKTIE